MENLALVTSLEASRDATTKLVRISSFGFSPQDGRVRPTDAWQYVFARTDNSLVMWTVWPNGDVAYFGNSNDPTPLGSTDIRTELSIDSNVAASIARANGAEPFLDRFPAARALGNARFQGGVVTWQISFRDRSTLCEPEFWIAAADGRLLARNLSCLS